MTKLQEEREPLTQDLLEKREKINDGALRQRDERDKLNDTTRAHAQRRDELNMQVRGIVETANLHRAKRDALNERVREGKARRDALNHDAQEKAAAFHALRREHGGDANAASAPRLKSELRRLEYEQQTKVMTPKKEKDLIDLIAAKQKELRELEGGVPESAALAAAHEAMRAARAAAEAEHLAVTQIAREAQQEHETMGQFFGQADTLRKQADAAQRDFVASKTEADRVHHAYIESIQKIRDIERVTHALKPGAPPQSAEPSGRMMGDQAAADAIFDRFRNGEKLSTEDLMALQRAGRL